MEEKLSLKFPVIVEGRYDKAKICMIVNTPVISLDGFSIFNNNEKKQLIKRMAKESGIILLTDSDRAGNFIRSKLKGILNGTIYNVYAPSIVGKEKRKSKPSADGLLGVEGIDSGILRELLSPFVGNIGFNAAKITKNRFFEDGFSGKNNSAERRKRLAIALSLPSTLSSNALLEAINLMVTDAEYCNAVARINNEE